MAAAPQDASNWDAFARDFATEGLDLVGDVARSATGTQQNTGGQLPVVQPNYGTPAVPADIEYTAEMLPAAFEIDGVIKLTEPEPTASGIVSELLTRRVLLFGRFDMPLWVAAAIGFLVWKYRRQIPILKDVLPKKKRKRRRRRRRKRSALPAV